MFTKSGVQIIIVGASVIFTIVWVFTGTSPFDQIQWIGQQFGQTNKAISPSATPGPQPSGPIYLCEIERVMSPNGNNMAHQNWIAFGQQPGGSPFRSTTGYDYYYVQCLTFQTPAAVCAYVAQNGIDADKGVQYASGHVNRPGIDYAELPCGHF
jgi:hypothetical protein